MEQMKDFTAEAQREARSFTEKRLKKLGDTQRLLRASAVKKS
jgi:hypothetical protein